MSASAFVRRDSSVRPTAWCGRCQVSSFSYSNGVRAPCSPLEVEEIASALHLRIGTVSMPRMTDTIVLASMSFDDRLRLMPLV